MKKPTLNKEIWLQSKIWSLNILAEELNQCRQKLAIAQKIHVNANLGLICNGEYEERKKEFETLEKDFYSQYIKAWCEWENMKDE